MPILHCALTTHKRPHKQPYKRPHNEPQTIRQTTLKRPQTILKFTLSGWPTHQKYSHRFVHTDQNSRRSIAATVWRTIHRTISSSAESHVLQAVLDGGDGCQLAAPGRGQHRINSQSVRQCTENAFGTHY